MRNSNKFRDLLVQYLQSPSSKKPTIYKEMKNNAKKFFDYAMLFQFGSTTNQEFALKGMSRTVLQERYSIQVQQNILDLFDAIDEFAEDYEKIPFDKNTMLNRFFQKYHERKDDLLFYIAKSDGNYYKSQAIKLLSKYYTTDLTMQRGINAKIERNSKLRISSCFGKNSLEILATI